MRGRKISIHKDTQYLTKSTDTKKGRKANALRPFISNHQEGF